MAILAGCGIFRDHKVEFLVGESETTTESSESETKTETETEPETNISLQVSPLASTTEEAKPENEKDDTVGITENETPENEETDDTKSVESGDYLAVPSNSGKLKVEGTCLVNESGEAVQLKGISTHGIAWFPSYINEPLFSEFRTGWDCNVIRLAMYTSEGGYCEGADKDYLLKLIDKGVKYATNQDMYVIIDWHVLNDQNPNKYKDEAISFFDKVSDKYKDNVNVIYEICNEPCGNTTWEDIRKYALEVIPAIRKNSPDSVIVVGTPNWSQFVDKAAENPITEYDNIMYTLHFYADTHRDDLRKKMNDAIGRGLPIFVTEYGICDASGSGKINYDEAAKWMETLNEYMISSCAWNLSNKNETSAILSSSCNKTSGLSDKDLSESGRWLYEMLTGNTVYEPVKTLVTSDDNNAVKTDESATSGQKEVVNAVAGKATVTLTSSNSWNDGKNTFIQYTVIVSNNTGEDFSSWTAEYTFDTDIEIDQGWCCNYSVSGRTVKLSNADFNGNISAGESIGDIGIIIKK